MKSSLEKIDHIKHDRDALLERIIRLQNLMKGIRLFFLTGIIMVSMASQSGSSAIMRFALIIFAMEIVLLVMYERKFPKTITKCQEYLNALESNSEAENKHTAT